MFFFFLFLTYFIVYSGLSVHLHVYKWPISFLYMAEQYSILELPRWCSAKESTCQYGRCKRCGFDLWVRKISWRMKWQPVPVFLPGKSHRQRRLSMELQRVGHDWATKHTHPPTLERPTVYAPHHFIHSFADGHLGCFHVLAIINRAFSTRLNKEKSQHNGIP